LTCSKVGKLPEKDMVLCLDVGNEAATTNVPMDIVYELRRLWDKYVEPETNMADYDAMIEYVNEERLERAKSTKTS
jgi:hypothetical protein